MYIYKLPPNFINITVINLRWVSSKIDSWRGRVSGVEKLTLTTAPSSASASSSSTSTGLSDIWTRRSRALSLLLITTSSGPASFLLLNSKDGDWVHPKNLNWFKMFLRYLNLSTVQHNRNILYSLRGKIGIRSRTEGLSDEGERRSDITVRTDWLIVCWRKVTFRVKEDIERFMFGFLKRLDVDIWSECDHYYDFNTNDIAYQVQRYFVSPLSSFSK